MTEPTDTTELSEAREILASLKTAYREHVSGRATPRRYKIKDREMEFINLADLLKQIRYWERQIAHLEAQMGERPSRPRTIHTRFGR